MEPPDRGFPFGCRGIDPTCHPGGPSGADPIGWKGQFGRGLFTASGTSATLRLATNGFANTHYDALLVQQVP
jgi:hypothetical protein